MAMSIKNDSYILDNIRYVRWFARKFQSYGLPIEDLIQEGVVGLLKAKKSFDETKGLKFITFARYWVIAEINEYCNKNKHKFVTYEDQAIIESKENEINNQIDTELVLEKIKLLDERSQGIIVGHNMEDISYQRLSEIYGVSLERIRQIEKQTCKKIREIL